MLPKKFLPITPEEWALIERYKQEEQDERIEKLTALTSKIFGRKRDHDLFNKEDYEREIKEF